MLCFRLTCLGLGLPKEKAKTFARRLVEALSGNHEIATVDMIDSLNRQLAGWAAFYKFTDFTARILAT